jgi:hypothetical protein
VLLDVGEQSELGQDAADVGLDGALVEEQPSKAVPTWLPILSVSILVTYVVPGSHLIGLVTQLPLAATCLGLAHYAWRNLR